MSEEKTYTKAEVDAAVAKAVEALDVDGLKAKLEEVMDEAKDAKRKLRAVSDIKPEDVAALETENERLRGELTTATKAAKDATKAAETATKALETEQGAARSYALKAEVSSAIAGGNIVPALVPAFEAMVMQNAKADLVDGKYVVTIGDKPAKDYISTFLESDNGKAFKSAAANGGGGAGGGGGKGGGKTMTRAAYDQMNPVEAAQFFKDGGTLVDADAA